MPVLLIGSIETAFLSHIYFASHNGFKKFALCLLEFQLKLLQPFRITVSILNFFLCTFNVKL